MKNPLTLPENQINDYAWVTVYQELPDWPTYCSVGTTQKQCSNTLAFFSLIVKAFTLLRFLPYFTVSYS